MGPTVLVVEDDPGVASVVGRIVRRVEGVVVEWVATGGEAVARVALGGIGLVICDVGLPDIDGYDVCRRTRAQGYAGPILVLTARHGPGEHDLATAAGASDFMNKPFGMHDLIGRVRPLIA